MWLYGNYCYLQLLKSWHVRRKVGFNTEKGNTSENFKSKSNNKDNRQRTIGQDITAKHVEYIQSRYILIQYNTTVLL